MGFGTADMDKIFVTTAHEGKPTVSYSGDVIKMTVKAGKDIRNKYVLPHLLWDLGILDDLCEKIEG